MERIKTLDDAIQATGMGMPPAEVLALMEPDMVAYSKLRIVAAALNGLTATTLHKFPQMKEGECRWYPFFCLWTMDEYNDMTPESKARVCLWGGAANLGSNAGLSCLPSAHAWSHSLAIFGSRLAVRSDVLAKYFGTQFLQLWCDYIAPKVQHDNND